MSEAEVKNVVNDAIKEYDRETAFPRHQQVLKELQEVQAGQNQLIGAATFAKWALTIIGLLLGIPASVFMLIQIIRAMH